MDSLACTGYFAQPEHLTRVCKQLQSVEHVYGNLVVASGPVQRCDYAIEVMEDPLIISADSISKAAQQLRSIQRNWWPYAPKYYRRSELLRQRLPYVSGKALRFPCNPSRGNLGVYMYLQPDRLLAFQKTRRPFPLGEARFEEYDEESGPPSRAYLKLFEALTLLGVYPDAGSKCLDLGASPGSWTWVLARLGARVIAIDRAPLDPAMEALEGVETRIGDAFQVTPERIGSVDWMFSDMICYPEKLFAFVHNWHHSGLCQNFVCTLKFKTNADYAIVDKCLEIEGSQVLHLYHNKHELTWMRISPTV